jgi:hypothetical protein
MTVVLLIAAVWLSLGIGVIALGNVVKSQYARRGDLGRTALAARLTTGPSRTVARTNRSHSSGSD